jgi:hypothetical protein
LSVGAVPPALGTVANPSILPVKDPTVTASAAPPADEVQSNFTRLSGVNVVSAVVTVPAMDYLTWQHFT